MSTKQDLSKQEDVAETKKRFDRIEYIAIGVVLVLFLGFLSLLFTVWGLVITYQKDSASANQSLRDEVKEQNDRIDTLTDRISESILTSQAQR